MFDELNKPANDAFADPGNSVSLAPADGAGTETVDSLLTPVGKSRVSSISKSTWAMVGLFLAGALVVGLLSLRSGPAQANATDRAVEQKVDQFITLSQQQQGATVREFQDTKKVVDDFYNHALRRQVPVDDLKSNPFIFGKPATEGAPNDSGMSPKRFADLQRECAKLKLQSVLMGPRGGSAIINSNFVAAGHTIGSFTVKSIASKSVELTCEGATFTLRVAE